MADLRALADAVKNGKTKIVKTLVNEAVENTEVVIVEAE